MTSISERLHNFRLFIGRSIAYPILIVTFFALILGWRIVDLVNAAKSESHSDLVIAQANYTLSLALDTETGTRGYLIDKNVLFLEPYRLALVKIGPAFKTLKSEAADEPGADNAVDRMQRQFEQFLSEDNQEIALAKNSPSTYRSYFDKGYSKLLMDGLRNQFAQFISLEESLKDKRIQAVDNATTITLAISGGIAMLLGVILGAVSIYQMRAYASLYEEALTVSQEKSELLTATLLGIGDAVLVTDAKGLVSMMNAVAEMLTGWKSRNAVGLEAKAIFNIVNETTRKVVDSPVDRVIAEGIAVGLANHTILIGRDGQEHSIDDSGAPIRDESGALIGVVLVFRDISDRRKAEEELANVYEREHKIAENLQRSLLELPAPGLLSSLEVETFYQPAWDEASVGGDFYDIFVLDDGRTAMIVGDVSGKGLKAASRTAEMKYTLRAYLQEDADPAIAASRLNRFVVKSSLISELEHFFLCLSAVVYDPKTNQMTVTVCGAEAPIVLRNDGTAEDIKDGGPPIGVVEGYQYGHTQFILNSDETVLISTDGITEARSNDRFLGSEGLKELALALGNDKSVVEIGNSIMDGVKAFSEGEVRDDICLLICRRRG